MDFILTKGLKDVQAERHGELREVEPALGFEAREGLRGGLDEDNSFFDAVHDVYLTEDLPLISAYNTLIDLVPVVHNALALVSKASAQSGRDASLQERCDSLRCVAHQFLNNISQSLKRIRAHKDYLPQLRIYKEFLSEQNQFFVWE